MGAEFTTAARLPWWPTSFVGRLSERAELRRLLHRSRLVTVIGPGGAGKTRLAVEAAAEARERFSAQPLFVDLSGLDGPGELESALPGMLGLGPEAASGLEALVARLREREVLLVLDNCEHVIEECARVARHLLEHCPQVRLLATSREPLGIDGEAVLGVSSLSDAEAVRLFVERAGDRLPGFAESAPATAVARVCARLDALPLAIELAAARIGFLSVEEIDRHLDGRFELLRRGPRQGPARHQGLKAAIAWSHELLSPEERRLFRRLAVTAGEFDLRAAGAIGAGSSAAVLERLVDKSMVAAVRVGQVTRYRLLETLRDFAWEQLVSTGEMEAARWAHLAHYAAAVEAAYDRRMTSGSDDALARLTAEFDNLRAALTWAEEADPATALRLAGAMREIWRRRAVDEGRLRLERLIASRDRDRDRDLGRALLALGHLAMSQRDHAEARRAFTESLLVCVRADDRAGEAWATYYLGVAATLAGDLPEARTWLEAALERFRLLGNRFGECRAVGNLGQLLLALGDTAEGARLLTEELTLADELGEPWSRGHARAFLAAVALLEGRDDQAARHALHALEEFAPGGDLVMISLAVLRLARALCRREPRRALALASAASDMQGRVGGRFGEPERAMLDEIGSIARRTLRDEAADRAWAEGRGLGPTEVLELARGARRDRPKPGGLTAREGEVAELVADGLTNQRIASRLHLSIRTVENHVLHACTKLGLANRTQLAGWVHANR